MNAATFSRFRPLLPLCLLAVWSLLSVGWSEGVDQFFEFITLLANWGAVFTFIAMTACLARFRTTMGTCLVILAMVVSLVALFSLVWQYLVLDRSLAYRGFRIAGSGLGDFANLRNPIDAGLFYGVFATVLVFYLCRQGRAALRWLCLVALLPLLVYLMLTYSRGAMFSFVAATVVIASLSGQRTGRWCAILLALLAACMALFGETLLQAELDKGFNGREPIWQHALKLISQAPLLGHGAGQEFDYLIPRTGTIYHFAHNYLLTLWN
ncbi:MAG: hypothetical protein B0D91_00255 [Oceanospirillales bacterium LUC14_002_19_P2]|nr:MAG: hypothetical protein B0D91_00255 [Oceanospirillales bacterium LUC14_002_19_P2]